MAEYTSIIGAVMVVTGILGSALFSGLETGTYTLNRVRLQILAQRHHRTAQTLRDLLADPQRLLGTLLIGNNLTNYLGTAALAVLLERGGYNDWQVVLLNAAIVTPLLFVFGEILPKDLFAAYSDSLMYRLTFLLTWAERVFTWTGFLPVVRLASRASMALLGAPSDSTPLHPRRQVEQLLHEGVGYGVVSDEQGALIARVLELSARTIQNEMVPWERVRTVQADQSAEVLWDLAETTSLSRFPVVDDRGRVAGVVSVRRALLAGRQPGRLVRDLLQPALSLARNTPVRRALRTMQQQRAAIAIVVDDHQQPVGLVTVKDLVEPITGELASW